MKSALFVLLIALFVIRSHGDEAEVAASKLLSTAINKTQELIQSIHDEWEIGKYPNFLKSCFMHRSSWEMMQYKYMQRLLLAMTTNKPQKFVISFTGSSVTAGHDSHFNKSTPVVTGEFMQSVFEIMNIQLESRNVALGNNPCVPYDVCVKTFAGLDADVVHWEQNYFCDGQGIMETFIRQAMAMPSRPIVVFSESNTGHWPADKCRSSPHHLTKEEERLLTLPMLDLVADANKDEYHRAWGFVAGVSKNYHGAGIQTFMHLKHEDYACLGPYIKDWMAGAASWYPSVIGHRLRAAHHAYFWLQIYLAALQDLRMLLTRRSISAALLDVEKHLKHLYKPMSEPKHQTAFADNMTCHTDYQPRSIQSASLKDLVIFGLKDTNAANPESTSSGGGWEFIIYEDIVDKNLVRRSRRMVYQDYKYLMYTASENAGPLSLRLKIEQSGPVFICQTPGIWGALPKGFEKLWENKLNVYIHYNTQPTHPFTFSTEKAAKLEIIHNKDLDICVQLKGDESVGMNFPSGQHILTLSPESKHKIIFAWLLHT